MSFSFSMAASNIIRVLVFTFLTNAAASSAESLLGRGFGDHIEWKTLDDGRAEAKNSHKPMMVIIHKSWCGACKALKPEFAESKEIEELSKKFVMVNVEDDEEPNQTSFSLDGAYIPRIFFSDSKGNVQDEIYNEKGNPDYKYYYSSAAQIVTSMKAALEKIVDLPHAEDEL